MYTEAIESEAAKQQPDKAKIKQRAGVPQQIGTSAAGAATGSSVTALMAWLLPLLG